MDRTIDNLSKTKITGNDQVNQLQDDTNNLIGNQFGEKGFLAPVGNLASKEGISRAERGGKDGNGSYGGPLAGVTDPIVQVGQNAGSNLSSGVRSVGNSVGGWFGGGSERK
jgi:hypothetical protein